MLHAHGRKSLASRKSRRPCGGLERRRAKVAVAAMEHVRMSSRGGHLRKETVTASRVREARSNPSSTEEDGAALTSTPTLRVSHMPSIEPQTKGGRSI